MKRNHKRALLVLLAGVGLLVMLIGLLTEYYDFIPEGLLGGVGAWILTAVLNQYFGPEDGGRTTRR